jgi:hypothetical protein
MPKTVLGAQNITMANLLDILTMTVIASRKAIRKRRTKLRKQQRKLMQTLSPRRNQVKAKSFHMDTTCTSHMRPFLVGLQNYTICSGLVYSNSKQQWEIQETGDIRMNCTLKNGSVSKMRICNILFDPQFEQSLISWRKLQNQYKTIGEGYYIAIINGDKMVVVSNFECQLCEIREVKYSANRTYGFCHQALGHVNLVPQLYDREPPAERKEIYCNTCTKSKLTHS